MSTIGIIVTYFPDKSFFEAFSDFIFEVDHWCIVDNGSDVSGKERLEVLRRNYSNHVTLIQNDRNIGLAAAQNQACVFASERKFAYFYFLDQDSIPGFGSVKKLVSFHKEYGFSENIGIVGSHVLHSSGKVQKYWTLAKGIYRRKAFSDQETYFLSVNTIISSGSLLPVSVWREVGPFLESYFIDYIDIEYCLRLRRYKYKVSVLKRSTISHQLGQSRLLEGIKGKLHSTFHSRFRRFMMARNRVRTWKLYMFRFPGWFFVDIGNFGFDIARILIVEKGRTAALRAIGRGVFAGAFGSLIPTLNKWRE